MVSVPQHDAIIAGRAKKLAKAFPKEVRERYQEKIKEIFVNLRNLLILNNYSDSSYVAFNSREYRAQLEDGMFKIGAYLDSEAVRQNPEEMISLLGKHLRMIFSGDFGLEAKVGGFSRMNEKELKKYVAKLTDGYKFSDGEMSKELLESRERKFQMIEEFNEREFKRRKNPYSKRKMVHPSQDSP